MEPETGYDYTQDSITRYDASKGRFIIRYDVPHAISLRNYCPTPQKQQGLTCVSWQLAMPHSRLWTH
jgi:hypothetical protein